MAKTIPKALIAVVNAAVPLLVNCAYLQPKFPLSLAQVL